MAAVKETICGVFSLAEDSILDVFRVPVLTGDGVEVRLFFKPVLYVSIDRVLGELDVEALLVFRSRIHRNRVFTTRTKLQDPMAIVAYEKKAPEAPSELPHQHQPY